MQVVPTNPIPSQRLSILLNGQACTFRIYQRQTGLFIDLFPGEELVIGGVVCLDRNRIVRSLYLGFIGDVAFVDRDGLEHPIYVGLGSRWLLYYLLPSELTDAS